MATMQVQCEMCCKEHAIGLCNECGNIGESCLRTHEPGKIFQTHILKMFDENVELPRTIKCDITEEKCKHHLPEKAPFFCKVHETMICGKCLQSDHIPCGNEVVNLRHNAGHIENDKISLMHAALSGIKNDILRLKADSVRGIKTSKLNVVKCNKRMDYLETRLKQNVEDFRKKTRKLDDENTDSFSCISSFCDNKLSWVIEQEKQLVECVSKTFTGHLFIMNRNMYNDISEMERHIKELREKHTFKQFCQKENSVPIDCLFEDLRDACEIHEEVDGILEDNTSEIWNEDQDLQKTRIELIKALDKSDENRKELRVELNQVTEALYASEKISKGLKNELLIAKQDLETSEKTRNQLSYDLSLVKQELNWSEKTRMEFDEDLQQAKHKLYESEQVRNEIEKELMQAKQGCEKSEKTKDGLQQELLHAKTGLDKSEKVRNEIEKELLQAKQRWENSEKTKYGLQHELLNAKMDLDKSEQVKRAIATDLLEWKQGCGLAEMARQNVKDELEQTKKELDLYQKERAILQAHFKDHLNWTQPTGELEVKISYDTPVPIIKLDYTFRDGLQTRNHPFPGNPYKGDSFTVRLRDDSEGRLACRMLKAAFRKGRMFIIGTDGMVVMDGLFLYNGPVENINHFGGDLNSGYVGYIKRLKGELADKGITDADIDEADNLEEMFTVESLSLLEAALSTVEIADECIEEAN